MRRRVFIALVGGAALAWTRAVQAQQSVKTHRIAFVHSGIPVSELTVTSRTFWIRTFFAELGRLGLVEGTNLVVERYSAEGNASRYAALAAEVVSRKPDVIVANSPALVKAIGSTIPIVAIMGDPVASGLVKSLARPGGSLTGVTIDGGPGMVARRLQILKEAVPAASKIVALVGSSAEEGRSKGAVATKLMPEIDETHLRRAFAELAEEKVDAVLVGENGSFVAKRAVIVELAAKHRLPAMYPYREHAEAGGLLTYGPELGELAKRMALQVQQILGGAKPGDIPIYQPTKFELVINLKTAKALGLTIPPLVLAQADEVIE